MPANPGQKRNQEKKKQRRDAAQRQHRAENARKKLVAAEQTAAQITEGATLSNEPEVSPFTKRVDYDALDKAAAEIDTLIKKKQYDEAEKKCGELTRKFPSVVDGLQRLARIDELRGDPSKALQTLYVAQKRAEGNELDEEASDEIAAAIARLERTLGR